MTVATCIEALAFYGVAFYGLLAFSWVCVALVHSFN